MSLSNLQLVKRMLVFTGCVFGLILSACNDGGAQVKQDRPSDAAPQPVHARKASDEKAPVAKDDTKANAVVSLEEKPPVKTAAASDTPDPRADQSEKSRTEVGDQPLINSPGVITGIKPPPPVDDDVEAEKERMRQETEDMIYALIRLNMEQMLIERRELLAAGRPPHDEEIRRLEDSIMRAQDLLMEAGEEVEPPDPPIVVSVPRDDSSEG